MRSPEVAPRYWTSDCTIERLASLMGEHGGRMCVASDEGSSILGIAGGRYASGQASFEVLLQGYSGGSIRIDRQSLDRPPVYIRRPRLTLCLTVQPSVIESMARDESMRSQGLLARFFYAVPASKVGERELKEPAVPDAVRRAYGDTIRRLAGLLVPADDQEIPCIHLSPRAAAVYEQFRKNSSRGSTRRRAT